MVTDVVNSPDGSKEAGMRAAVMRMTSALLDRVKLASKLGFSFGGKRDLYGVLGYETAPTMDHFIAKYMRQDIAARIVDAPPDAIWSDPPEMLGEPALVSAWNEIVRKHEVWTVLHRADRLARLGRFSVILFGFDKGRALDSPVKDGRELIYIRPIGESNVTIESFVTNPSDPNFGKPELYTVKFDDPTQKRVTQTSVTKNIKDLKVHHSRVLHIVENPLEDEVLSVPIMAKVYNLLDDLLKVAGGSAETYWLAANRGIQADIDKEMEIDPNDAKELSDAMDEYQHQLRRILRTRGVKLNVLSGDMADPKNVFDMIMSILSGATGIPKRILTGAEAGQLASEQDRANWAERIVERRKLHAEPYILRRFIGKLQQFGTLPEGDYEFKWPEAFKVSPLERAQTMAAAARAVGNLSRQTGNKTPMQITSRVEARAIIGLEGDLPEGELQETEADLMREQMDKQAEIQRERTQQGGPGAENEPTGAPGEGGSGERG
jgi:hypothetical protein